jgi:hypothetical protein
MLKWIKRMLGIGEPLPSLAFFDFKKEMCLQIERRVSYDVMSLLCMNVLVTPDLDKAVAVNRRLRSELTFDLYRRGVSTDSLTNRQIRLLKFTQDWISMGGWQPRPSDSIGIIPINMRRVLVEPHFGDWKCVYI